jgi:hypothetical protein
MRQLFRPDLSKPPAPVGNHTVDETKNAPPTARSGTAGAAASESSEETRSLSLTTGSQASGDGSSSASGGDPSKIGRYRVIHRLGQGGFGRVYLAHDDDLDRPVAIKVPSPDRTMRPEDAQAFLDEARILAKLDHPNIVPVRVRGAIANRPICRLRCLRTMVRRPDDTEVARSEVASVDPIAPGKLGRGG